MQRLLKLLPLVLGLLHRSTALPAYLNISAEKITNKYNVIGDYIALQYDFGERQREHPSCLDFARALAEPYTEHYWPRTTTSALDGGIQRAFWKWKGPISRAAFLKAKAHPVCPSCMILHYKIQGLRLYLSKDTEPRTPVERLPHREAWEEMLSIVLYLYPMPDMEFLLLWSDDCMRGLPLIAPNICRQYDQAGFTMPSFAVWLRSMGSTQIAAYHSCLWARYPPKDRLPRAVWRGSTTGTHGRVDLNNYEKIQRIKLHLLARNNTDVLDAQLTRVTEAVDSEVKMLLNDTASPMHAEDYNRYSVIIDVDGNGWSDRFGYILVNYPTIVLKSASNRTGFFEHFYAPGVAIHQFDSDLSDLVDKVRDILMEIRRVGYNSKAFDKARAMQGTTRLLMDHIGIAEAFAYSLLQYKKLISWELDTSLEDFTEISMSCCTITKMPDEFAAAVSSRLNHVGQGRQPGSGYLEVAT